MPAVEQLSKRTLVGSALVLAITTGGAVAQQGAAKPEDLVRQFAAAMAERDADKVAALYAERAVLMMPEGPVAAGREQIKAIYARNFAANQAKMALAQARVDGDDDAAVMLWVWNVEITPPGREAVRRRIRSMLHVKKTPGGWQIFADMYQVLPAG